MQGKLPIICPEDFLPAIDKLSKGSLIDLLCAIIYFHEPGWIGRGAASRVLAAKLQPFVNTTLRNRGHKPVDLEKEMNKAIEKRLANEIKNKVRNGSKKAKR